MLIHSLICPSIKNPACAATKVTSLFGLRKDGDAGKVDHTHQVKSTLHDEFADNYEFGDGSEMHEDTEEINALLYSDDDYSEDDNEVRSTGHSPSFQFPNKLQILPKMANLGSHDKHEQCEGITEEASCYNDPNKRQKLIDSRYRTSLSDTATSVKFDEMRFISSDKQARKKNLCETLKVLESIVPGTKGKDPLAVLNDAINYLNCLKLKATSLGGGLSP